ncbi:MAG: hypothetical protein DRN40_03945 [Thermoplasmata archaeon]|nr:MAG: hypothetical protein DRN40_03945 [Thermoplasmata archaeon]
MPPREGVIVAFLGLLIVFSAFPLMNTSSLAPHSVNSNHEIPYTIHDFAAPKTVFLFPALGFHNIIEECTLEETSSGYSFKANTTEAHIRTRLLSPIGLSRWIDFGFSYDGFLHGGTVEFRVLDKNETTQLFPDSGYYNTTSLPSGWVEGYFYDHVGVFGGPWTSGDSISDAIIVEIRLKRYLKDDPIFYGFAINYTTSMPIYEDFSIKDHVTLTKNCTVEPKGIILTSREDDGEAIIGPIEFENKRPDVLGLMGYYLGKGVYVKAEILTDSLTVIPGFTLLESSSVNTSGELKYIHWGDKNIKHLPGSVNTIYIRLYIKANGEIIPIIHLLVLEYSTPPQIDSVNVSKNVIYRGGTTALFFCLKDREDPPENLQIFVSYKDPKNGSWLKTYLSEPLFSDSEWLVLFSPGKNSSVGKYLFRATARDSTGNYSNEIILPINITVLNCVPSPPKLMIFPSTVHASSDITVEVTKPGTDYETPEGMLKYNYRYYVNERLVREFLNSSLKSDTLSKGPYKREDRVRISVSTWDGLNESLPTIIDLSVENSPPTLLNHPKSVSLMEDSSSERLPFKKWFSDPDGDALTYNFSTSSGVDVSISGDSIVLVPNPDFYGNSTLYINVSDGIDNLSLRIPVVVLSQNDPPVWSHQKDITVMEGEWAVANIDASDPHDGEDVNVWSNIRSVIPGLIDGVNYISYPNGTFKLKATNDMVGSHRITFYITDGFYNFTYLLNVTVINVNNPPERPVIKTSPDKHLLVGKVKLTLSGECWDPDLKWRDNLTYIWTSNISGELGVGKEISVYLDPGIHRITLTVSDSKGFTNSTYVVIVVLKSPSSKKEEPRALSDIFVYSATLLLGLLIAAIILIKSGTLKLKKEKNNSDEEKKSVEDENKD